MAFEEYVRIWVAQGIPIDEVFRDLSGLKGFIGAEQVEHDRPGVEPFNIVLGLRAATEEELKAELAELRNFRWHKESKGQRNRDARPPQQSEPRP